MSTSSADSPFFFHQKCTGEMHWILLGPCSHNMSYHIKSYHIEGLALVLMTYSSVDSTGERWALPTHHFPWRSSQLSNHRNPITFLHPYETSPTLLNDIQNETWRGNLLTKITFKLCLPHWRWVALSPQALVMGGTTHRYGEQIRWFNILFFSKYRL